MACDPASLMESAKCIEGYIPPGRLLRALIAVVAVKAGVSLDSAALVEQAKCVECGITPGMQLAALIGAMCQISIGPSVPTNPDISAASTDGNLIVTWNQTAVPTSNEVWRSKNGGAFALLTTVAGATTQIVDNGAMVDGDLWTYKVRAVTGGTPTAFTGTVSALKNFFKTSTADTSFSFPDVVFVNGKFEVQSCLSLTSISVPLAHTIMAALHVGGCTALTSINFGSMTFVGDLDTFSNPALASVDYHSLVTSAGQVANNGSSLVTVSMPHLTDAGTFDVANNGLLTSFNAALLVNGGGIRLNGCPLLTSASFPLLETANEIDCHDTPLTTLSMPHLINTGNIIDLSNTSLTVLSWPNFTTAGDLWTINNTPLTQILLPNLTEVDFHLHWNLNASLTALSLPSLGNVFGDINMSDCTSLVTVSFPILNIQDGTNILFNNCALSSASVNHILALGVLTGTLTANYNLSGGTNGPPTGQGIADKAALISAGNTVTTN